MAPQKIRDPSTMAQASHHVGPDLDLSPGYFRVIMHILRVVRFQKFWGNIAIMYLTDYVCKGKVVRLTNSDCKQIVCVISGKQRL